MPTQRSNTGTPITGEQAEKLAERFLLAQGLQLKARNFRCKAGEIDLIMQHGDTLVFVEVRYRSNPRFGSAADSVDRRKRTKLIRAAGVFLAPRSELAKMICRFDVIAVGNTTNAIEWHRNAFDAY